MTTVAPRLLFLRHADAGDPDRWTRPDAERPLSAKGRDQAERVASHLAAHGPRPVRIIASPKVRARETARAVGRVTGLAVEIADWLAGSYDLDRIEAATGGGSGPVMLVGHDPDMSTALSEMLGRSQRLKKGRLAVLGWNGRLEPGGADLLDLVDPATLDDEG